MSTWPHITHSSRKQALRICRCGLFVAASLCITRLSQYAHLTLLVQDMAKLQLDQLQPYMLPWDARHLQACMSDLLSEDASYGTLEPSLFCSPGSNSIIMWSAGTVPQRMLLNF